MSDAWQRAGGQWLGRGLVCIAFAALIVWFVPAHDAAAAAKTSAGSSVFVAAAGASSLAGFSLLAVALERIAEFALAPWWGLVDATAANKEAADAKGAALPAAPAKVGVSGAAALQQTTRAAAQGQPAGAGSSSPEADSAYVKATQQRPTIMLPMAAAAAVICSCLHLYLLHSLAKSGFSNTQLAFLTDALITGFAIAGGAQPFHDLVGNLTSASTSKQASAKSS